jgi:ABC-type transporter Mla subunit MlaD
MLAAASSAAAQTVRATPAAVAPVASVNQRFARCPKSVDQFVDVMKQLVSAAARARTLADENPLLEPDAAYYEAELAATRKCAPTVAVLGVR